MKMADFLKQNGYDGLYNIEADNCACLLDDLAPCDGISDECTAGYKEICIDKNCDIDCTGWHIAKRKKHNGSRRMRSYDELTNYEKGIAIIRQQLLEFIERYIARCKKMGAPQNERYVDGIKVGIKRANSELKLPYHNMDKFVIPPRERVEIDE
jgi:hypothetical protein